MRDRSVTYRNRVFRGLFYFFIASLFLQGASNEAQANQTFLSDQLESLVREYYCDFYRGSKPDLCITLKRKREFADQILRLSASDYRIVDLISDQEKDEISSALLTTFRIKYTEPQKL